jgi:hypothetical protein
MKFPSMTCTSSTVDARKGGFAASVCWVFTISVTSAMLSLPRLNVGFLQGYQVSRSSRLRRFSEQITYLDRQVSACMSIH